VRIGIDYLPAVSHWPGVGRYARELVRALVRLPSEDPELCLFEVGRAPRIVGEEALGLTGPEARHVRRMRGRTPRRLLGAAAALGFSADRLLGGVDLFHQTAPTPVPVRHARETLAVAELPAPETQADLTLRDRCARADGVLVFSEFMAGTLEQGFDVDAARIHRVPVGCDHWRRDVGELPERDSPPSIVALGAVQDPRRHGRLLMAAATLAHAGTPVHVHLIGRFASQFQGLLSGQRGISLTCRGELSEPELARTVASASALVHLREVDATAVTPLEALALGTPVVASRIPCYEEALGDEAVLVDNDAVDRDPSTLARALESALESASDPVAGARRMRHAEPYTWEANARATVEAWRHVLEA